MLATAAAAGFAVTTWKSAPIAHPVLQRPLFGVEIAGWIEVREERERTDRIVVRVHRIEGAGLARRARTGATVGAQGHRACRSAATSNSRRA